MRRVKDLKEEFYSNLKNDFSEAEIEAMFGLLIQKYLPILPGSGKQEGIEINGSNQQNLEEALSRLKNNEPIQYILGEVDYLGRRFKINSHVHVPRRETETMINWVREDFPGLQKEKDSALSLLDIGTGCGLLPILLGKELPIKTTAVDLSEKALDVARENAEINKAEVQFIRGDIFTWKELPEEFDIIVSNPPYVLEKSRKDVQRKFLKYEPPEALYVKDDDPMIFNRKIAELAKESLSDKGAVYVEINKYLGAETAGVFAENGFRTEIRQDVYGSDRTVKAVRQ